MGALCPQDPMRPGPLKIPVSVLVVIHTPALEVLMIRRADGGEHRQAGRQLGRGHAHFGFRLGVKEGQVVARGRNRDLLPALVDVLKASDRIAAPRRHCGAGLVDAVPHSFGLRNGVVPHGRMPGREQDQGIRTSASCCVTHRCRAAHAVTDQNDPLGTVVQQGLHMGRNLCHGGIPAPLQIAPA